MSIFNRLTGKDPQLPKLGDEDMVSDELPPREPDDKSAQDKSPEEIARSIRAELDVDADDIEDIAETPIFSKPAQKDAIEKDAIETEPLELSKSSVVGKSKVDDETWVSAYVDARGIPPVTREENETPIASLLEDIYESKEEDIEIYSENIDCDPQIDMLPQQSAAPAYTDYDNTAYDDTEIEYENVAQSAVKGQGMNLGELRLDIVRITSDIESGEALYRRAQQRVDSLIGFIEQAEVAVSVLAKMEPENRRLKASNRSLETDVEAQNYKLARLETDLEDQRELATKAHVKVETLRGKLADLNEALSESHREAEMLTVTNDDLVIQAERTKTNLDIETRENITLREKLTELSAYVENLTNEKIDLQKSLESSSRDFSDVDDRNNSLETENAEMRLNLRHAERQNAVMKDELVEIQDKIVSFKTQHETHIHRRDDKIASLSSRNIELEKALKHKENIIQSTILDVSQLRKHNSRHDIEREKLEKIIESQNYQLSKTEEKLLQSKQKMTDLDQRYKDVAEALAMKRMRQTKARNASPDIQPSPDSELLADGLSLDEITEITNPTSSKAI